MRRLWVVFACALVVACGDDGGDAGTAVDTVMDADSAADSGADADTSGDSGVETDSTIDPDSEVSDTDEETSANTDEDVDSDSVSDTDMDMDADSTADTAVDPDSMMVTDAASDTVADTTPPEGTVRLRIMAGNLTSGSFQRWQDPGLRMVQTLAPDIAILQELNFNNSGASFGTFTEFIDLGFGDGFSGVAGVGSLPNGVVSRYPILESGTWDDPEITNREFEWARIDIPGDVDLWTVSVHFKSGSSDSGRRTAEAVALVALLDANVPEADYVVMAGDLNTQTNMEPSLMTLGTYFETGEPRPADQDGNENTNSNRTKPYDWVLADEELDVHMIDTIYSGQVFPGGFILDTRVYSPASGMLPALPADAEVFQMQHMGVIRDFAIPAPESTP
jgi:endonuclease/exonuclease/phosphatase family metal-dependent hydrolase